LERARAEERSSKDREGGAIGEGMIPLPTSYGASGSAISSPSGVQSDLAIKNVLSDNKADFDIDFADIKYISLKFSSGSEP